MEGQLVSGCLSSRDQNVILGFHKSFAPGIRSIPCPKIQRFPRLESLLLYFGVCSHCECGDRFVGVLFVALFSGLCFSWFLRQSVQSLMSWVAILDDGLNSHYTCLCWVPAPV